jgi:hypothetical protein
MTAVLSMLQQLQSPSQTMSRSGGRRLAERSADFDLKRSRESRRRHRVLISTQHLAAFFDCHSDHSQTLN